MPRESVSVSSCAVVHGQGLVGITGLADKGTLQFPAGLEGGWLLQSSDLGFFFSSSASTGDK